jgi:hypothetical protein
MNKKYIYVVVRKDLSPEQQAVQACHAVSEAGSIWPEGKGSTIILLGVKDREELELTYKCSRAYFGAYMFREPDLFDSPTAFATWPLVEEERAWFKDLKTLRFPKGLLYHIKVFLRAVKSELTE